jgi:hypothetical protein
MKPPKSGSILRILRYICISCVIVLGFISIIGSGGGGGDDAAAPGVVPGIGTVPVINDVVLTDENFNPKAEFAIGDTANFMVTATDPNRNMEELIVEQYFPSDTTGNPFYGPDVLMLPSQSKDTMTYMLSAGQL